MRQQKAIIDFKPYRQAELAPLAMKIVDTMTANKSTFPTPTPSLENIIELATSFSNILGKAEYPGRTGQLHELRKELEGALKALGTYVNGIAKGDLATLEESGFPLSKTPTPHGPIPAPIEVGVEIIGDGGFTIWTKTMGVDYNCVLFAYAPITNIEKDPSNWTIRYSPNTSITLRKGFTAGVSYKFAVAFGGSVEQLNWTVIGKTLFAN